MLEEGFVEGLDRAKGISREAMTSRDSRLMGRHIGEIAVKGVGGLDP